MKKYQSTMQSLFGPYANLSRILFAGLIKDGKLLGDVHKPNIDPKLLASYRSEERLQRTMRLANEIGFDIHHIALFEGELSVWSETIYPLTRCRTGRCILSLVHPKEVNPSDYMSQIEKLREAVMFEK